MDESKKFKHQIFKSKIPCDYIISFFDDVCDYDENTNTYMFHYISYKRALFNNNINKHISVFEKFYHKSKQSYLKKSGCFKGLTTIIRQICKLYTIKYMKTIKYMFGTQDITYKICLEN